MSKMDDMRALREARYAATKADAPKPAKARPAAATRTPKPAPAAAADGLCGHRAISGRTCTREHGHPEKSHRYA